MSWIDVAALVVVAIAVYDGAKSGLAWALLETLVLAGGACAAAAIRPHAEPYVLKIAALGPRELPWITHAVMFALCACSLFGLLLLVHPATKKWRFKQDRWFGGAVGFVNGVAAALVVTTLVGGLASGAVADEFRTSRTARAAHGVAESVPSAFPDGAAARLAELTRE